MAALLVYPVYFPCVAQMGAMLQAGSVVFEVHDNYQKQTYRNRMHIAHANGKLVLNVPIKHVGGDGRQRTADVLAETAFPWQSQHWKSLQSAYRTSPFFEFYEDELAPLFTQEATNLQAHNIKIFETLCELMDLSLPFTLSESYQKNPDLPDGRVLVKAKGGIDYQFPAYTQVFGDRHGFLSNLSILDLLFNEGPNSAAYLEQLDITV